jgi:hypothetical protein
MATCSRRPAPPRPARPSLPAAPAGRVQRRGDAAGPRVAARSRSARCGARRERAARGGQGFAPGGGMGGVGVDHPCGQRPGQHAVAGVRPAAGWRSGRRAAGDCGRATSSAASAGRQARGFLARTTPAWPRAPLRYCRHRGQGGGTATGSGPWSARRSSASATRIWRSLPRQAPVPLSSSSRATCIVRWTRPTRRAPPWRPASPPAASASASPRPRGCGKRRSS